MRSLVKWTGVFSWPFLQKMLLKEGAFIRIVGISSFSSILAMIVPIATGNFIDCLRESNSVVWNLVVLLVILFLSLIVELSSRWYASKKSLCLKLCLQNTLVQEFVLFNPARMSEFKPGELAAKFTRDSEIVASIVMEIVPMATMAIVGLSCAFWISFRRSSTIGIMMILLVVVCAIILLNFTHRIAKANHSNRITTDSCMSTLIEMIGNLPCLKAMSAIMPALSRIRDSFEYTNLASWNLDKENLRFESTVRFIMFMGEAFVLSISGMMAYRGHLTVGDVIVFQMLFAQTLGSISNVFRLMPSMGYINEAAFSIDELINFDGKELDSKKKKIKTFDGRVELLGVSFAYRDDGKSVIDNISFALNGRECCAVMGVNGSGKTTLGKLVGAFSEPKNGRIFFDGIDWREIDRESLRHRISFLFQSPMVFSGTLRENITLGECFSEEELCDIVKVCGLNDFVENHKDGIDYYISSDNGLSGGEMQRIAIARALIRKPDLLILDEPGNHIDEDGIVNLEEIIKCAKKRASVLLITHDKNLASIADRIVTVKNTERNENE